MQISNYLIKDEEGNDIEPEGYVKFERERAPQFSREAPHSNDHQH